MYSRAGLRFWGMLAVATVATALALAASWTLAIPAAFSTAVVLVIVLLGAWLQPHRYTGPALLRQLFRGQ